MNAKTLTKSIMALATTSIISTTAFSAMAAPDIAPVNNVNWENYPTAEADHNFSKLVERVEINTWLHQGPVNIDQQETIRSNVDTIYSNAIVDISKGATFTIPAENNNHFQIIQIMDEEHLLHKIVRRGESVTITMDDVSSGTHVHVMSRTRYIDGLEDTLRRQQLPIIEANSAKPYVKKDFALEDVEAYRYKLLGHVLQGKVNVQSQYAFGATLDDVRDADYKYLTAMGYAGMPGTTAQYLERIKGQGSTECQEWTFRTPELSEERGGFYSVSTYSTEGWVVTDKWAVADSEMRHNGDGTASVLFNCGTDAAYDLDVVEGWTAIVRYYEPADQEGNLKIVQEHRETPLTVLKMAAEPFSTVDTVDSSNWKYDPATKGMTAEQFIEAESVHFMNNINGLAGGLETFYHFTDLSKAENRWVVSPNNDTIYSMAVADISKGFSVTIPSDGDRYITVQIATQDHTATTFVGGGTYEFPAGSFNGTHVAIGIRVGTDGSAEDIKHIVENMQPQMKIEANSSNPLPSYDKEKLLEVRAHMMQGYNQLADTYGLATRDITTVTDWENFAYATAGAWGLNTDDVSMYAPSMPVNADQNKCYTITMEVPEVEQFWSMTVYNNEKYLMSNDYTRVNTYNANMNEDGSVTIHASNNIEDGEKFDNFLYVNEDNWGTLIRAYGVVDTEGFTTYEFPAWTECK